MRSPRCVCGLCNYCKGHRRYLKEKDVRIRMARARSLAVSQRRRELGLRMQEFTSGVINLDDFEDVLDEFDEFRS